MKDLLVSIRMYIFWTVLLGLIYPLLFTGAAQALFNKKATGGVIERGGQVIGAALIAQKFESEKYFWPRPSAVDYNPLPSGGSNSGPTAESLKTAVNERLAKLKATNPGAVEPPQDLLFASASGLDPHISPAAADYQVARVAKARGMDQNAVAALVAQNREDRQLGFLGEARVNVLNLNLALDSLQGMNAAPTPAPTPVATATPTPAPEAPINK